MKRILIACLLGIGLLLPVTNLTAKEFSKKEILKKRIVDVTLEGHILTADSDSESGEIDQIDIYNSSEVKVIGENCGGGYTCYVDVSSLPRGIYKAKVYTEYDMYIEYFSI